MNELKRQVMPPLLSTRCPAIVWKYLTWIAANPALEVKTMREFTTLNAPVFFDREPWNHGLKLRKAPSIATAPRMTGGQGGGGGDVLQANILLGDVVLANGKFVTGEELREMFKTTAREIDEAGIRASRTLKSGGVAKEFEGKVTVSTLAYMYLYWLAVVRYPPGAPLTPVPRYRAIEEVQRGAA